MTKFSDMTLQHFAALIKTRAENRKEMIAAYTGGFQDYQCDKAEVKKAFESQCWDHPSCQNWRMMENDARDELKKNYNQHFMPAHEINKFLKLGRCVVVLGIPEELVNVAWALDEIRRAHKLYLDDKSGANDAAKIAQALKHGRLTRSEKEIARATRKLARDNAVTAGVATIPIVTSNEEDDQIQLLVAAPQSTECPEDWARNFFGELNRFLQMESVQKVLSSPTTYQRVLNGLAGQIRFLVGEPHGHGVTSNTVSARDILDDNSSNQ